MWPQRPKTNESTGSPSLCSLFKHCFISGSQRAQLQTEDAATLIVLTLNWVCDCSEVTVPRSPLLLCVNPPLPSPLTHTFRTACSHLVLLSASFMWTQSRSGAFGWTCQPQLHFLTRGPQQLLKKKKIFNHSVTGHRGKLFSKECIVSLYTEFCFCFQMGDVLWGLLWGKWLRTRTCH